VRIFVGEEEEITLAEQIRRWEDEWRWKIAEEAEAELEIRPRNTGIHLKYKSMKGRIQWVEVVRSLKYREA
jgi:hypothetical protein